MSSIHTNISYPYSWKQTMSPFHNMEIPLTSCWFLRTWSIWPQIWGISAYIELPFLVLDCIIQKLCLTLSACRAALSLQDFLFLTDSPRHAAVFLTKVEEQIGKPVGSRRCQYRGKQKKEGNMKTVVLCYCLLMCKDFPQKLLCACKYYHL